MWLHLLTGSLLIFLATDFWQAELAQHTPGPSDSSSFVELADNQVRLFHRGSGRREMLRNGRSAFVRA